ncbi:hypothetical protein [Catenuloplanes atrovinosus]|uniref:GNAT superfamily N-acetyltransferase n=1 Tax=Catenuloplanes atrovinosus TaxID=137266 RepID=A0AAE3YLY5_9ACTN|nr:hypothetical protein [Catenuloplanes atrovinosus]MDR7274614.1 GNAT superfamily N-acetyltransferase [Catenuloplanes atrovinosus]
MHKDLAVAAETVEAHAFRAVYAAAPPDVTARLGLAGATIGGATVIGAPRARPTFWTRTVGLGATAPATPDVVGEVLDWYRAHDVPAASLHLAPPLMPPDWADVAAAHRLTPGPALVKLVRAAEELPTPGTSLSISPIGAEEAAESMAVLARGFGWDERDVADLMRGAMAEGLFTGYAARDGDTIVSAALLAVSGSWAFMNGAGTLPEHRGRGGQTALLAARVSEAARRGCTHVCATTWIPAEGQKNPSLDNMLATGFRPVYEQSSWRWTA